MKHKLYGKKSLILAASIFLIVNGALSLVTSVLSIVNIIRSNYPYSLFICRFNDSLTSFSGGSAYQWIYGIIMLLGALACLIFGLLCLTSRKKKPDSAANYLLIALLCLAILAFGKDLTSVISGITLMGSSDYRYQDSQSSFLNSILYCYLPLVLSWTAVIILYIMALRKKGNPRTLLVIATSLFLINDFALLTALLPNSLDLLDYIITIGEEVIFLLLFIFSYDKDELASNNIGRAAIIADQTSSVDSLPIEQRTVIMRYHSLLESGAITREEYEKKVEEIKSR